MGRVYDTIDDTMQEWLAKQPLFFVGTAPNDPDGHVNVSPKGGPGLFRVLGPRQVAYVDLVGSGAETVAHLRENGRIVVMLCAFEGPPRILRLHGRGEVVTSAGERFEQLLARARFDEPHEVGAARRAVIVVAVERIADSCGYGVPLLSYEGERPHMGAWAEKRMRNGGPAEFRRYVAEKNSASIDGLPAFED